MVTDEIGGNEKIITLLKLFLICQNERCRANNELANLFMKNVDKDVNSIPDENTLEECIKSVEKKLKEISAKILNIKNQISKEQSLESSKSTEPVQDFDQIITKIQSMEEEKFKILISLCILIRKSELNENTDSCEDISQLESSKTELENEINELVDELRMEVYDML